MTTLTPAEQDVRYYRWQHEAVEQGRILRAERCAALLTQGDLARTIGCARSWIAALEAGDVPERSGRWWMPRALAAAGAARAMSTLTRATNADRRRAWQTAEAAGALGGQSWLASTGCIPAWDALRDPLWVVESLQWLTDAVAYLLVTRATERYEPTPLPEPMRAQAGELPAVSDREQLQGHAADMGELWQRLVRISEHFEQPFRTAPPAVRAQAVASLNRPDVWPSPSARAQEAYAQAPQQTTPQAGR